MKSEERHKLQQNALAEWLNETFVAIKPYQNAIVAVIIVLILAVIFFFWWTSESASQSSKAWTQFFMAANENNPNPAALGKVADDNPSSRAAPAADIVAADLELAQGCSMLFINKPTANQQLNKAVELYQLVITRSSSPTLRAQASFGLGKTWEALGKLNEAVELYTKVTTEWPDTVYARMSTQRLDDLKRTSTKEVYDKFGASSPSPHLPSRPGGTPISRKYPRKGRFSRPGLKAGWGPKKRRPSSPRTRAKQISPKKKPRTLPIPDNQAAEKNRPTPKAQPGETKPAT